jgi:hypothetical protein
MKAALVVAAGWMLSCAVLEGAERGFEDIVRVVSDRLHARPMHIPFFGLVNIATFVAHPAGVKHIDLAVFEKLAVEDQVIQDLAEAIRSDGRWKPFVQVHSSRHGHTENVLVYMEGDRNDCKVLVITLEPWEATVVEVKLNPESLEVWLNSDGGVRALRSTVKTSGDERVHSQFSGTDN